jgi:hypothetical protein
MLEADSDCPFSCAALMVYLWIVLSADSFTGAFISNGNDESSSMAGEKLAMNSELSVLWVCRGTPFEELGISNIGGSVLVHLTDL